jgi:glycosyltransferase involved in cell wall biosynthesis
MILSAVRNHPAPAKFHVLYFYSHKDHLSADIAGSGANIHHLPAGNSIQLFFRVPALVRLINKLRPDVVHAHLPLTGFISMIAAGLTSTPLLYTEHNLPSRYRKITGFLHRFTLRFCKNIIAVSEAVLSDLNRMAPNAQARLLENGVDVDFFNPGLFSKNELRRKFNIPENKVVIGTVAVFTHQKRLDRWLDICKKIHSQNLPAFFILAGHGPLEKELLEDAHELINNNSLMFAGKIHTPEQWMAAMDIYLMSSDFEGLPVALLEAMSLELPVVVTPVGGIPSAVTDRVTGLTYPTQNPEQAVSHVLNLISNPGLRSSLGKEARKMVIRKFDIKKMTEALNEIYMGLIKPVSNV